jgi:hypothetical protein
MVPCKRTILKKEWKYFEKTQLSTEHKRKYKNIMFQVERNWTILAHKWKHTP